MDFTASSVMDYGDPERPKDEPMSSSEPTPGEMSTSASPADGTADSTTERRPSQRTADGLHKHSCVVCATRKIKCDRKEPCGNCVKGKSQCIFRNPAPPRRRKKGAAQNDVLERLKRAEELLSIRSDATENSPLNNMVFRMADINLENRGKLINENGSSRYLDNTMWLFLNEELRDIRTELEYGPDGEGPFLESNDSPMTQDDHFAATVFGASPKSISLPDSHPSSVHIMQLWQLYLQNVQPIAKIAHAPTVQELIIDAVSHLDKIPRALEAYMFCMYFLVTATLNDEECREKFHETRQVLVTRYRCAAQAALLRADYLASYSLQTLQAYMLYLLGCRGSIEPAAMWALSGIAVRMAHRQGLHRDGETLGLSLFDSEMRRRLWWEIVFFDSRTAMLSGTGGIATSRGAEFKPPRNVNDSELYPGMTSFPEDHDGITEMVNSMIRAEIGNFLVTFPRTGTLDGAWQGITHSTIPIPEKDKLINDLEARLHTKFLSKLDPLVPTHLLAKCIAISASSTIRFMAHVKSQVDDPQEQQLLFDCACAILENTLFIISEPSLLRFSWSTRMHFQHLALIYLLRRLRQHTRDAKSERGWQIVYRVFGLHPPVIAEAPRILQLAVADLTLSAWNARVAANPGIAEPDFIKAISSLRGRRPTGSGLLPSEAKPSETYSSVDIVPTPTTGIFSQAMLADARNADYSRPVAGPSFDNLDWEGWERLMEGGDLDAYGLHWQPDSSSMQMPSSNANAGDNMPMETTVPADFYLR